MILSTHAQFDAQTEEQNAGLYLTDLDDYMTAIETLIDDSQTQIVIDAAEAKVALEYIKTDARRNWRRMRPQPLSSINALLAGLGTNVNTYVAEIEAILALDADYVSVEEI